MANFLHWILAALLLETWAVGDFATEGETPAWTQQEMYRDMFPLDKSNFSAAVLRSGEAWIVLFHQGTLERTWKQLAVRLRGIVWFGLVHTDQQPALLKEIRYHEKANGSRALVFLHGPGKAARWRATSDPETAKVMATDSLPDVTLDVRSMGVEEFVVDCLMSRPSRFPVLLLTEDEDVSSLWRALSFRLQRYFQFGRLVRPRLAEVRQWGLRSLPPALPHLLVLTTTAPSGPEPDFQGVPFTPPSHGALAYPDVFRFLYVVNRDFRHLLYGSNMADRREEVEMLDVLQVEGRRFDLQGVTPPSDLKVSMTGSHHKAGPTANLNSDVDHDETDVDHDDDSDVNHEEL